MAAGSQLLSFVKHAIGICEVHTSEAKEIIGESVPDMRTTECAVIDSSANATAGFRHHIASFTTVGDNESSSLHSSPWIISAASNAGYQLLLITQHTTRMQARAPCKKRPRVRVA